jgi:hypothetical protein
MIGVPEQLAPDDGVLLLAGVARWYIFIPKIPNTGR